VAVLIVFHFIYLLVNGYTQGQSHDEFANIVYFAVLLPLTLAMIYVSYSSIPPKSWWRQGLVCIYAYIVVYLVAVKSALTRENLNTLGVATLAQSIIFYGAIGPMLMLFVYKINRWTVLPGVVLLIIYYWTVNGRTVTKPYNYLIFITGFYIVYV